MHMLTKDQINQYAEKGSYLPHFSDYEQVHLDMDGKNASKYLESKGFTVINNYDTGRNGLATTACGIQLSTNGYIRKLNH